MKRFDIPAAAVEIGFSVPYVRTLIRTGKIKTTLEPVHEGSNVLKHVIEEDELQRFVKQAPHKSRRQDGRNKYNMYATNEELIEVRQMLYDAGKKELADLIVPANRLKHWDNGDGS